MAGLSWGVLERAVSVSSLTVGQGDGSWRPGARASFGYRPAWFQVRVQLAAERCRQKLFCAVWYWAQVMRFLSVTAGTRAGGCKLARGECKVCRKTKASQASGKHAWRKHVGNAKSKKRLGQGRSLWGSPSVAQT